MTGYGPAIFPQHAKLLADSAIDPEVARERGYVSVDSKSQLAPFKDWQRRNIPGLLIPVHDTTGAIATWQYRPDKPRVTKAKKPRTVKYETPADSRLILDVPPRIREQLDDPKADLWITEGARKADAAVSAGLCCIALAGVDAWQGTNAKGGKTALADWKDVALNGRRVYLAFDSDAASKPDVAGALERLGAWLGTRKADVRYCYLPDVLPDAKTGLDDYLAAGRSIDDLVKTSTPKLVAAEVEPELPTVPASEPNETGKVPRKPLPDVPPQTITQVEAVYARWLHDKDKVTTRAVHAVYVANMVLSGDPVWLFLVGGSGSGKTERLIPLAAMPDVVLASKIRGDAALLSATPRKDRAETAHGGLLRQLGGKGVLVLKDFTTVLEMDRSLRGDVLAAMREIYDGRWDRTVGTDGGQTLTWEGKCGFLAGVTGAIDRAHAVVAEMGPRSLYVRLPPADLDKIGKAALAHMGREDQMRQELRDATVGLLANLPGQPHPVGDDVTTALVGVASLVSQSRSAVQRDFKGEIELVLDSEAPTRIIKQLGQIWRACGMLGLGEPESWEVVRRCALDSIPKLRGAVIRYLSGRAEPADTTIVAIGVVHPTRTVRRALEDLAAHGVVQRKSAGKGHADYWELSGRARGWTDTAGTLPETLGSLGCDSQDEPGATNDDPLRDGPRSSPLQPEPQPCPRHQKFGAHKHCRDCADINPDEGGDPA